MSARLMVQEVNEWPRPARVFLIQCDHGGAQRLAHEDFLSDAAMNPVEMLTGMLERDLHAAAGCDCRVPCEGEIAR